jgi:predicted AAA+ superfamily ATPase
MLRRYLTDQVAESLRHFPVVLLTGARQVGKSTLAQGLIGPSWKARYVTLDDRNILDSALRDPDGLIAGLDGPAVLDEVQRAPDLLRAIKKSVDENNKPGRFLLTGSANLLTLSQVSESLAGRISIHTLLPFSWAEKNERSEPKTINRVFHAGSAANVLKSFSGTSSAGSVSRTARDNRKSEIIREIMCGGFPPAFLMNSDRARGEWFAAYRQTYLERDLLNIRAIEHVPDFNRLLTLAALRTGRLVNLSDLARDSGLAFTTLRRYMNLLDVTYQVSFLPPFQANIGKRLAKTPKLFFHDTGMAAYFAGLDDWQTLEKQGFIGSFVESWAASEIRKLMSLADRRLSLFFWRTQTGQEADFLIERAGKLIAVEVKWGSRVEDSAVRNLERCMADLKDAVQIGVIIYGGTDIIALSSKIVAVPFPVFFGIE